MSSGFASAPTCWCAKWSSTTTRPFTPLCVERAGPASRPSCWIQEDARSTGAAISFAADEAEAEKDAVDRRAIVAALDQQLKRGDKALIGNSALLAAICAPPPVAASSKSDPGKLAEQKRASTASLIVLPQQCTHQPVAGSAPISRPAAGGGFVPHCKGTDAHETDRKKKKKKKKQKKKTN